MVTLVSSLIVVPTAALFFGLLVHVIGTAESPVAPAVRDRSLLAVALVVHGAALGIRYLPGAFARPDGWTEAATVGLSGIRDAISLVLVLLVLRFSEGPGWLRRVWTWPEASLARAFLTTMVLYLPLRLAVVQLLQVSVQIAHWFGYEGATTHRVLEVLPQLPPIAQVCLAAWVVLATPLYEELVFRGVLYGWLRTRLAEPWAIAVCGLVFGLYHEPVVLQPSMVLMGSALALVYARTGSLCVPVVLHAFFNAHSVLVTVAAA